MRTFCPVLSGGPYELRPLVIEHQGAQPPPELRFPDDQNADSICAPRPQVDGVVLYRYVGMNGLGNPVYQFVTDGNR